MSKYFLCVEHGEPFIVNASDFEDAEDQASMYGGSAIRELSTEECDSGNIPEIIAYEKRVGR